MQVKLKVLLISIIFSNHIVYADEGLWLPLLLEKYRYADMQAKGLKISAEDIYSINHSSLKDAVCLFGGGCTAGVISDKGLIITNHHCGYGAIQDHSTPENDYLTSGFWAASKEEELVNKGLTTTFLVRIEDVTAKIFDNITENMPEVERNKSIAKTISGIVESATEGTHYKATVKAFYYGNEYYLFVTEVFEDVRLVGAPPSGIGKFGGDTDNWMWPRHTGDFSVFRIYADTNNKPSEYNPSNVPYRPSKSLEISIEGIKDGDFTFVYGFPSQTQEYLTSYAVAMIMNQSDLCRVKLRQKILDIMKADMDQSDLVRFHYSAKASSISNGWKKWIGEINGLKRLKTIEKKENFEKQFTTWVNGDSIRVKKYGSLLADLKSAYVDLAPYSLARDYINEAAYQIEIIKFAQKFNTVVSLIEKRAEKNQIIKETQKLSNEAKVFFKDYNPATDKKLFTVLLDIYYNDIGRDFRPDILEKYHKNGFSEYAEYVFSRSAFTNLEKVNALLDKLKKSRLRKIRNDPAYLLYQSIANVNNMKIKQQYEEITGRILVLNRKWMKAQMEIQPDRIFYPDANLTLRVAYGNVNGYSPCDAVKYDYFTTLGGIIEKADPDVYDYRVPEKLIELYYSKDYGRYGEQGIMPVCFITSNHTSGGNSGSPVLDAEGKLIGINFDRNWEGTMSDIEYDPSQCRNIVLDIRFALFIIDKFAGAGNLIKEMNISGN
jgi:hypothetical protein